MTNNADIVRGYRPLSELLPAHWQRGELTTSDGQTIRYVRTGSGRRTIMLLHGFQSAGLTWLRTAKALDTDYDVLMPDFRAHGASADAVSGFSLSRLTEDMTELLRSLALPPVVAVGHSLGAEVAGRLAGEYPDLVSDLVLVDPPMRAFNIPMPAPGSEMPPWLKHWYDTLNAIKAQPYPERLITALAMMPPGSPVSSEDDYVPYVEAQAQLNLEVLQYSSSMDYSIATTERSARIRCPFLLITGSPARGSGVTPEGVEVLMNGANRQHLSLEAGHFIQLDQFDAFIDALKSFIRSL